MDKKRAKPSNKSFMNSYSHASTVQNHTNWNTNEFYAKIMCIKSFLLLPTI